jgi:hypothetical protein
MNMTERDEAITGADIDTVGHADRQWWDDWQNYTDGAGFDVAAFEAERDFLDCGCMGRDWTCGHFGWSVAVVKVAS